MNSPQTPTRKLTNYEVFAPTEYFPRARKDLTPIFELVQEMSQPTLGQKSYYGKRRTNVIKADI